MSKTRTRTCPACKGPIEGDRSGRRKFCATCTPPGSGGAAWKKAWLEANRERLEQERQREREGMLARLRENVARRKALAEKNRRKRGPAMRKSMGGETR
jgi:hypothetical protein